MHEGKRVKIVRRPRRRGRPRTGGGVTGDITTDSDLSEASDTGGSSGIDSDGSLSDYDDAQRFVVATDGSYRRV